MTKAEALGLEPGDLVLYDKTAAGYDGGEIYGIVQKVHDKCVYIDYEDGKQGIVFVGAMLPFEKVERKA